jgi:hypothetical protein
MLTPGRCRCRCSTAKKPEGPDPMMATLRGIRIEFDMRDKIEGRREKGEGRKRPIPYSQIPIFP